MELVVYTHSSIPSFWNNWDFQQTTIINVDINNIDTLPPLGIHTLPALFRNFAGNSKLLQGDEALDFSGDGPTVVEQVDAIAKSREVLNKK